MNIKSIASTLLISIALIGCNKDCDEPIPEYCQTIDYDPDYYDPVCGCDGETYNSSIVPIWYCRTLTREVQINQSITPSSRE